MTFMSDMDDLQKKQGDAAKLAQRMAKETDPEKMKEMAQELQNRTDSLRKMAMSIAGHYAPQGSSGPETRVMLTPAQKERIAEQTGVGVEMVTLHDTPDAKWSKKMTTIEPREIERMAGLQAAESRLISDTRTQVEKIIKILEKQNVPELQETIEQLKADPTLGLKKKDK
jgi:hypothetical protein